MLQIKNSMVFPSSLLNRHLIKYILILMVNFKLSLFRNVISAEKNWQQTQ